MSFARAGVIASAIVCLVVNNVSAQPRSLEWIPLGCLDIRGNPQEVGTIRVDVDTTQFRSIRLSASGSNVILLEGKVTYATGDTDFISVETLKLAAGGNPIPVDLQGSSHELREIELIFKSSAVGSGRRRICAEGQVAATRAVDVRDWVELGCHTVNFSTDLERFRILNQSDRFEALRLAVRDNDVQVLGFNVTYFNGAVERLALNPPYIYKDRRSQRIALKQGPQRIRDIDLYYTSISDSVGQAVVCVQGLLVPGTPPPVFPSDTSQISDPDSGWERLGCQLLDTYSDTTKVYVGRDRGRYTGVQIQTFQNDIRVDRVFLNLIDRRGDSTRKRWNSLRIRPNNSMPLLFDDGSYRIDTIEISYRSTDLPDGQAVVCFNGQRIDNPSSDNRNNPRSDGNWRLIGCQPVQSNRESDVYLIDRNDSRYRAIRFYARSTDVYLRAITIMFEDGGFERILMSDNFIPQGGRTGGYSLGGKSRMIERILLSYDSGRNSFNDSELCVEGM